MVAPGCSALTVSGLIPGARHQCWIRILNFCPFGYVIRIQGCCNVINFEENKFKKFYSRWKNLVYNQSYFKLLYEIVMALEETFSQLNL